MGRKQNPAREHHFVPAGYLGRFARPLGRQGRLFVFDSKTRRFWNGTAETQARRTDLHTIEGEEPDRFEKNMGAAESDLLPALQRIEKGVRSLPDVEKVAAFVALQLIRSPERLEATRAFMEQVANGELLMLTHTKQAFDASIAGMKATNPHFNDGEMPSFETMNAAVRNGSIKFEAERHAVLTMNFSALDAAIDALAGRRWLVFKAGLEDELLTSSRPVVLSGTSPVGLGTADQVIFPISPQTLFMAIDGAPGVEWRRAPSKLFGRVNLMLASQSRMIFGSEQLVTEVAKRLIDAEVAVAATSPSAAAD